MAAPAEGSRRVVRVRLSLAFLSDLLKCREIQTGERVSSNLPGDAQIVRVVEMPEDLLRGAGVLTLLVESDLFPPCELGLVPPEFDVIWTRKRLARK